MMSSREVNDEIYAIAHTLQLDLDDYNDDQAEKEWLAKELSGPSRATSSR